MRTILLVLALVAGGCDDSRSEVDSGPVAVDGGTERAVGEACAESSECAAGLSCFEHQSATPSPVCMTDCDLATSRLCGDGTVCTPASGVDRPAGLGVCYLGGTTAEGSACTNNLECARGTVCVITAAAQSCFRACTVDGSDCGAGETCTPLEGMGTKGYCAP